MRNPSAAAQLGVHLPDEIEVGLPMPALSLALAIFERVREDSRGAEAPFHESDSSVVCNKCGVPS